MNKKNFYIQNKKDCKVIEKNVEDYIKGLVSVLRRVKEKDNDDKIENACFEIEKLGSIYESIETLEKIFSDNSLREIKEEPYVKKIQLTQKKKVPPKLNQNEFKEIIKNIGSIIKIENPLEEKEKKKISEFMKTFKIKKETINLSHSEIIFKPILSTQTIINRYRNPY